MSEPSTTPLRDLVDTDDTVMVAISGFTVLIWDHLVTFDDEVELVWKRGKGVLAYLFLINRYLTPLGFIVNLVAFTLPGWGTETFGPHCQHFVRYEGAMTVVGTQIAGFMMFLRIRAIYNRNQIVVWSIMALFLVWLGVNAWLLTTGEAVPHDSGVQSCSMIFNTSPNSVASASAWLPLLYDTCIFALTLYRTNIRTGHIIRTVLSDGILYYSVICAVNVALTIMIVQAAPGVKNIAAQLELLLTVAMVSRITLNLRKEAVKDTIHTTSDGRQWMPPWSRRATRTGSRTVKKPWTRSLSIGVGSIMPQRDSIAFRSESVSYPEQVRLSTTYYCTPDAMTPAAAGIGNGATRFNRPRAEQDVEAM